MYNNNRINSASQSDVPQEVTDMERKTENKKNNTNNRLTALYCRLSRDDGTFDDSSSIQTQKTMLTKYAADHGYWNTKLFIDDGYSGTNFNRPAFQEMLAEVKAGHIERIITKDLSRLGRNYLETGSYIEVFFPNYHVQYIAVNDGVDSQNRQSMDITPFKNLLNDLFASDVSSKIRSAMKTRAENGLYTAPSAPYGYKKREDDHHQLVIDERYAPTVRQIYDWCVEGDGVQKIRNKLRERKIPRPGACSTTNYEHTGVTREGQYDWSNNSVRMILINPVYAGHLIAGRRPTISLKSKKRDYNPYQDSIVAYNTHEGIVTQEKFDLVQRLIASRKKRVNSDSLENIFSGLVKCADCGYAMTKSRAHRTKRKNIIDCYIYMCNQYRSEGKGGNGLTGCTQHKIEARDLYETVLRDIQYHARLAVLDDEGFLNSLVKKMDIDQQDEQKQLFAKARKGKQRLEELDNLYEKLYEDRAAGNISERNFSKLSAKYEQEQNELEQLISKSEKVRLESKEDTQNAQQFVSTIREYAEITELTAAILNTLIDKITVAEAKEVDGEMKQKITIYYKFIGSLDQ